jgi:hypothetical protein
MDMDSFFFSGDRLVRLSTDEKPLKKPVERQIKQECQAELKRRMEPYIATKPSASLTEVAYAYHRNITLPPVCRTCGKQTKFGRDDWAIFCGARCQMSNPDIKQKRVEESLEKWGVKHQFLKPEAHEKKQATFEVIRQKSKLKEEIKVVARAQTLKRREAAQAARYSLSRTRQAAYIEELEKSGFTNVVFGARFKILHATHKCGSVVENPRLPIHCYVCEAPAKESAQWRFSNLVGETFSRNKRIANGKFQLDAYWEEQKLAIEYNGLYWHSTAPKPGKGRSIGKFYHQDKMLAAKDEGIRLITVWEDDARRPDFKKHFENLFSKQKINGRNCEFKYVAAQECKDFLKLHHRDGWCPGVTYNTGLYFEGELVAVATFGRNRFKGEGLELYRLATKTGVIIRGGVSKIISNFRKTHPSKLTTYADASWGWGDGYLKAGATFLGITKPGYFYFDQKTGNRIHRLAMSRSNFEKTTGCAWDSTLNEEENAARVKCWQVWDCGNWKFVWDTGAGV